KAAARWLRARGLPVFCTPRDAKALSQKGIKTTAIRRDLGEPQPFFNGRIRTTPCVHGRGIIGSLMEHGVGYFIELPGEPSLFLTGDTVLTAELRHFVEAQRPDLIVASAGGARFDVGGKIIMDDQDMVSLARLTSGAVVANHIGAISHCPVSREDVTQTAARAGLADRISAPADGEELEFS
ncbi:MAG: MBL fold metallo-hydrolase, partial [Pseudomonadota bacterium]